jgi:hypothetical protein
LGDLGHDLALGLGEPDRRVPLGLLVAGRGVPPGYRRSAIRSPLRDQIAPGRTRHPPIPAFLRAFDGRGSLPLPRIPGRTRGRRSLPAGTPAGPPRRWGTSPPLRATVALPRSVDESSYPRSRIRIGTEVGGSGREGLRSAWCRRRPHRPRPSSCPGGFPRRSR